LAKHLKLNIKNAQLAAALKQNKDKKTKEVAPKNENMPKTATVQKQAKQRAVPSIHTRSLTKSSVSSKSEIKEEKQSSEQSPPKIGPTSPDKGADLQSTAASKKSIKPKAESFADLKKREQEKPLFSEKDEGVKTNLGRTPHELRKQQNTRFDARDRQGLRIDEEHTWRRRRSRYKTQKTYIEVVRPKNLSIRIPISVKNLAHAMKLKASALISKLLMQGVTITINDLLDDPTTIQLLGQEFSCEITIDTSEEQRLRITDKTIQEEILETDPAKLQSRAPVIAFMGHVDHGKTSLIDSVRKSNLAKEEAGAITQHIGAFTCSHAHGTITILDTPGHEAFGLMRQRGTVLTDVIVLVIAGDEGIMPQTDEAIALAKASSTSLVVAINKCDNPAFNAENVYRQLADRELLPEIWGGNVITVICSAMTGEGVSSLLEMVLLQAEMLELRANPNTRSRGTVLESQLHKGFGSVATILVQNGTLKIGDALVFEDVYARIKTMHDEHGKELTMAVPSTPVKITGISGIPQSGCEFIVVKSEKMARKLIERRCSEGKQATLQYGHGELEKFISRQQALSEKKFLNIILCADVQGSIEAIRSSLLAIKTEKVELNFVSESVGEISESDVELAAASNAVIIGFHTKIESHAENFIKKTQVVVKIRNIIYQIIDDVKNLMINMLEKVRQEFETGTAEVKKTFTASQIGSIAGCVIIHGTVKRGQLAKIFRKDTIIWEGNIVSIKRVKEDVKEVGKGLECGILLNSFNGYQEGDLIKAFDLHYATQEL